MFGLPENILTQLKQYFSTQPQVIKVIVFGSRAMGKESPGSDIDLAIITKGEEDISGKILADLEELHTPYIFDVIDYGRITHQPLREHIDRVGKLLYLQAAK